MSRQREATRVCKTVLEPLLAAEGFDGAFPFFSRRGKRCVECVSVSVFVRGGVRVQLGSVNLEPRRTARALEQLLASHPPPLDVRTVFLPGSSLIDTAAQVRALEVVMQGLPVRLRGEGRTFWAAHAADVAFRERLRLVSAAVAAFDAKELAAALASMPKKEAQRCLDAVRVDRWHERSTIERVARLAPVLLEWRAPWMLGALITTSMVLKGQNTAVLAWARRSLKREYFAAQLASFADRLVSTDVDAAATLFELCAGVGLLEQAQWGNALFSVMSAEPARQRRMIALALKHAGEDPSVQFNVACLWVELGDPTRATEALLAALGLGAEIGLVKREPVLRGLLGDARVVKALQMQRAVRPGPVRFRTHAAPR